MIFLVIALVFTFVAQAAEAPRRAEDWAAQGLGMGRAAPELPTPCSNEGALLRACRDGNSEEVLGLLTAEDLDPSAAQNEALVVASSPEVVLALLNDKRVDPTAFDNRAVRQYTWATLKLLLEDKRVNGTARLQLALEQGDVAMTWALMVHPRTRLSKLIKALPADGLNPAQALLKDHGVAVNACKEGSYEFFTFVTIDLDLRERAFAEAQLGLLRAAVQPHESPDIAAFLEAYDLGAMGPQ